MAEQDKETLELIAGHLALAMRPLAEAVQDLDNFQRLMRDLGWDVENLTNDFKRPGCEDMGPRQHGVPGPETGLNPGDVFLRIKRLFEAFKR